MKENGRSLSGRASDRILLLDDLTRCPHNGVERHPQSLAAIKAMLSPAVAGPFAIPDLELLTAGDGDAFDVHLSVSEIMEMAGQEAGLSGWARFHQLVEAPARLVAYLRERLAEARLVIGFELPTLIFVALCDAGYRVIDLGVGPIRFLPELNFEVRSSSDALHSSLSRWVVPDSELCAGVASYSGMAQRTSPSIEELGRVGLLLGQTAVDTSLIFGDGMFDPAANVQALLEWAEPLDTILYKPHPFHLGFAMATILEQAGNRVLCTDFPTYQLLSLNTVKAALAISSGTLVEAKYFNVEPTALMTPPRWGARRHHHLAISPDFLSPAGLSVLLDREIPAGTPGKGPSLRRVLGSWGDQEKLRKLKTKSLRRARLQAWIYLNRKQLRAGGGMLLFAALGAAVFAIIGS
ncbi:hypothetical protein [Leisingera caerulea]|uniref:Uncharacterized protein n=1 Tax=Leisingera caerulea TaxID=506591 RepID=A0A9Q9M286_LEICA|nr:hypothetical protein [Leisingera caerulea]UWQ55402.1 hypothetical protein K3721_07625 [Leisingera caerulea]